MEQQNRRTIEKWLKSYNEGDIETLVTGCYTPDFVLKIMGGETITTRDAFRAFEHDVLRMAPRRFLRLDHVHACGNDVLVIEAVLLDPTRNDSWELPWCTVMTFRNGLIAEDRNYLNFALWPANQSFTEDAA